MKPLSGTLESSFQAALTTAIPERFESTHWSVVLAADRNDDTASRTALARLCQTYWYPLYAFVRRRGFNPEDAKDLTQAFFAHLLENRALATTDRAKGRFRSFLLASLRNFLTNEWERASAQKRGGGCEHVSLDTGTAEMRYESEPADSASPDRLFDRSWALTLLERALVRLRDEQAAAGQSSRFEQLRDRLTGEPDALPYAELAAKSGQSEAAMKMAVSRLRRRYGELLREEIAQTVSRPEDAEQEIRHLFAMLTT